ncbi:hypothetical protein EVAR_69859_1 [Eumeta japonica]|uniref:Uncharacterized protein n=1 Tax=Eumeta variegata TaxID=151549 RepID=A0A4C2AGG0_EUMVA|nr:hypothetical protein EVAR_69859_1 [Eumeta japonica]
MEDAHESHAPMGLYNIHRILRKLKVCDDPLYILYPVSSLFQRSRRKREFAFNLSNARPALPLRPRLLSAAASRAAARAGECDSRIAIAL